MVLTIYEVYLSNESASYRPDDLPEGRMFLARPGISQCQKFTSKAILDTSKVGNWPWPKTDENSGWAPWTAFSSFLPVFENTDHVLPWQWPLTKP
ncbi:MAG TPA: hypothetical protein P5080_03990 [Candidatus Paceibacterota bacterium]|nr:hypothetical protein [Candidatus Pacearchaeota archaeon]HRZ51158.1 hypothetical protein [Candidatus Paceibacterota bacterium]HSA36835.1 hypothetical protein [Candidatus Paceibacterota bacterium]